jgi:putative hemolysin
MRLTLEIALIFVLLVANGIFAMSEIAVVSSRRARLQRLAEGGDAGARRALALAQHPSRFLSTVQIGITLVGIFAGAFGGATIAGELAQLLAGIPHIDPYRKEIALAVVVGTITFF